MGIIKTSRLLYNYIKRDEEDNIEEVKRAVDYVDIDIKEGEFVAILGHNGSGKSTLAKHMNALLLPTEGTIWIDGRDSSVSENLLEIRKCAGMVFQNPDNQIIGTVVEEDVGFGLENIGVPTEQIWKNVNESLDMVGMNEYRKKSPNKLSGGQKQRVAIAGVVAMRPKCIVLDEPTAMLDPMGRKEVIASIRELNKTFGITIILITHYMEEAVHADKVYIMDKGRIVMQGTPKQIFTNVEELRGVGLSVPKVTELAFELRRRGVDLPEGILTETELANELCRTLSEAKHRKF